MSALFIREGGLYINNKKIATNRNNVNYAIILQPIDW